LTLKPNLNEIKIRNNNYYLQKLQKQEINWEILKNIKFHTVKFRNILEILADEDKSYFEKATEWLEIVYNWLVDIKVTIKNRLDFVFDNPDYLEYLDKKENWENVSIDDYTVLQESIDRHNGKVKQNFSEEKFYKELSEIEKQRYLWNYEEIVFL